MEESKEDENIRYQNLSELSQYIFSITKIIENLSNKPIQMKKEFDVFCKKEAKNFDRLINYFNSIENSPFPSNFWDGNKSNIKITNKGSLRDIIEIIKQENIALKNISDISNVVNTPNTESLVLSALGSFVKNKEIERLKNSENDRKVRIDKSEKEYRMSLYFPKERIATDSEKIAILEKIKEESGIGKELDYEILENKIIPTEQSVKEFFEYRKTRVRNGWGGFNSTTKESYDLAFEKIILNFKYLYGMEIKTKTKQERLSYIFSVIMNAKKKNKLASNDPIYVEFSEIIVQPYFFLYTFEEDFIELLSDIKKDKDFFRKHNMIGYNPGFEIDPLHEEDGIIKFTDFTDDFIKEYTEDRLNIEQSINNDSSDKTIQNIDIMIPDNEWEDISMFINSNYNNPIKFRSGNKYIKLFYTLAENQSIPSNTGLVSYFNSNKANPLYKRTNFDLSKILVNNKDRTEPNISILLKSSKSIAHATNRASRENKKLKST